MWQKIKEHIFIVNFVIISVSWLARHCSLIELRLDGSVVCAWSVCAVEQPSFHYINMYETKKIYASTSYMYMQFKKEK